MEITDVRVRKVYSSGKMRGIVSVTFDGVFVIHDIKVIEGQNGFFVAMPSRKTPDGEFKDICHPITSELRREMQQTILAAYEQAAREMEEKTDAEASALDQDTSGELAE